MAKKVIHQCCGSGYGMHYGKNLYSDLGFYYPRSRIGPLSRINLHKKLTSFYVKKVGFFLGSGGRSTTYIPDPT
jgi:hypothetical protein